MNKNKGDFEMPGLQKAQNNTVAQRMGEWLNVHKMPALRESTKSEYRSHFARLQAMPIGSILLDEVTRTDCQKAMNNLAEDGYSKSTIKKYRLLLRQFFDYLIEERELKHNPAGKVSIPNAPTKKVKPLSQEEQDLMEAACANDPLGHLIVFLFYTGLRKSEMMALKWEDYNAAEPSIIVRASKTDAGIRKVFLVSTAQDIIEKMPRINEFIFNHTRQAPVTDTVMKRLVDRLRIATGFEDFACHVCRHSFVTRLCEKCVPAKAIAEIIGHARSDYVLDIYAELEADELRKAVYVLEKNDDKRRSALMGATITLPSDLYMRLQEEAKKQHVSVDALATFLLTSVTAQK